LIPIRLYLMKSKHDRWFYWLNPWLKVRKSVILIS
jgi:hypothetical protein